jgi:bacterioferritin-associated ferredoxin
MGCPVHAPLDPAAGGPPPGRAMTRCECAGVTFAEVARRAEAEGVSAEQAIRRSGCGQNCEACLPDLRRFLAARAALPPAATPR